jgi:CO/xanthine dehydrogenase FAD-binding subunit
MQNFLAAPTSLAEAVAELTDAPGALIVAGGTDVMVDLAAGRRRAGEILTLAWVPELAGWEQMPGEARLGAALTCTHAAATLEFLPALAQAAAAMGTPQVRNAATLGGNLASAAGGDLLPVLLACEATVELASAGGVRSLGVADFLRPARPGARTALRPGELICAVRVPLVRGAQEFCRVAVRGADAPAWLSMALVLDVDAAAVRLALVSGGAVPVRVAAAEAVLAGLPAEGPTPDVAAEFARRAGEAAGPDPYRRHAAQVCAGRLLARALGAALAEPGPR